ncbi:MAG: hypothetical protein KDC05_06715 [Bacteroidales bacterium]|nr:hypothetical protein [Bacteroidales bacterium]
MKYLFTFLAVFILFAFTVNSQTIALSSEKTTNLEIRDNSYEKLSFRNSFSVIENFTVKHETGFYSLLTADNYGSSLETGNPRLPVLKKVIEVPLGANPVVTITKANFQEFDLAELGIQNPLMPVQPSVSKSIDNPADMPFEKNEITYQTDALYGFESVKVELLGQMRGVMLARLEISPISYNPVQQTIRVCTDLDAEISFVGGNAIQTIQTKQALFSPYFEGLFNNVSNYKTELTDELIMDEPVTYIIVSDPMFATALQPFIEWKTKKGFNVVEAYTDNPAVGTTTTSIQAYLEGIYNTPPGGYNAQSFVLFVGDVAQIPTFSGTAGSHVSDLYYCEYTGDLFPECFYGRFSANNLTELQPQIDKTLEYEQFLMPDPGFLDQVLMVAGDDESHEDTWGNGQINYGTQYYFNAAHGLNSHTFLQDPPMGNNGVHDSIIANMNSGISYGNYSAHCSSSGWASPSFTIGDISSLNNVGKYPLLVGNCCLSVTFNTSCFGEEILRAENKGALGYIGGSNSTYWDEDFWWGVGYESISANPVYNAAHLGAYDRTFHDMGEPLAEWYITQGQMPVAGNLAVTQAGSSLETYYWEIYHLMGDPSVMIYLGEPPVTNATYAALMPLGSTAFTVNTHPYAYVAISKGGVLHGAAIANASGVAEVMLDPITVPGAADIVVTRQNGQPFMGTVTVASPTGPYLSLEGFTIDDNTGNNNGEADYNESLLLDVNLENLGSTTATNVSALLSTADSYVAISDDAQNWPDIPNGTTSLQTDAFAFTVSDDVPDQHVCDFQLEITDGTDTWNAEFSITINAPFIEAGALTIDDAVGGNGNNRLDPGETADVIISVMNNGQSTSPAALALLTSTNPFISLSSGIANPGTLGSQTSTDVVFTISCDAGTPVGTAVDLILDVTAGNYGCSETYYRSVGLVLEDWETGDFSIFPWTMSGNADWSVVTTENYEGLYSAKSGTITHNQSSELSITVETTTTDDISFFRKVSSESGYDYLQFWMDDTQLDEWAGEVDWSEVSFSIPAGVHTFKWIYDKDGSVSNGSDCAWVDYIVFPPIAPMQPEISVAPTFLDFGDIIIGQTAIVPFEIENTGSQTLTGTVTSPPSGFIVALGVGDYKNATKNAVNFAIAPGQTQEIEVIFEPLTTNCYSDNVHITSNDPEQPALNVAVTGCGYNGPDILYNPQEYEKTLALGYIGTEILNIQNKGDLTLDYTAHVVYNSSKEIANVVPADGVYNTGSCTSIEKTETSLVSAFPTEEAGWMKFDISDIPVGATINSLTFHGYVNATNYPYWSMTPISSDPVTTDAATLHADIAAEASTGYYLFQNETSSYTTGWKTHTLPANAIADLEASLSQGWFAVGIVSRDGSSTYYIKFDGWSDANPPYIEVDYTYNPPYTWLQLNDEHQVSGSVLTNENIDINVKFDANNLAGTYFADIVFTTNDPDLMNFSIPVTLHALVPYEFGATVYLQGVYNGSGMSTSLNTNGMIPLQQPFNVEPFNYDGTEVIPGEIPTDVVDWVLVELRDAPDMASATPATTIGRQAALLKNDGSLIGLDPDFPEVVFYGLDYSYDFFMVIWHRNHIGVISAYDMGGFNGYWSYNFTAPVTGGSGGAYGQVELKPGVFGMVAGDGDCDGEITSMDIAGWKTEAGTHGMNNYDQNMDGEVNNLDKDDFMIPNMGSGCQVPE